MNAVGNYFNENVRGTGEQGAFRTNAHAVAEEMSKVFKGANLSRTRKSSIGSRTYPRICPPHSRRRRLRSWPNFFTARFRRLRKSACRRWDRLKPQGWHMPIIKDEGQRVLERVDKWVKDNA
jgi:hypothetical protein